MSKSNSKKLIENTSKNVDCAIIFMLDEERNRFLEANHRFISLKETEKDGFIEFLFLDRDCNVRIGVMCSDGTNMGNHKAGTMFYKLSRRYKASLYLNIGVAARLKDVNVGDVLFIDRLSSAGENNANNKPYQHSDTSSYLQIENRSKPIKEAIDYFISNRFEFSDYSQYLNKHFQENLRNTITEPVGLTPKNKCKKGHCISFPEVIKDLTIDPFNSYYNNSRLKMAVADMEAFYFSEWHDLIKREESITRDNNSEFIAIKSVSDCGDGNKPQYEDAGSRQLAMNNLAEVVTCLCCDKYPFPRKKPGGKNLYPEIERLVSKKSVVRSVNDILQKDRIQNKDKVFESFQKMIQCFIRSDLEQSGEEALFPRLMDYLQRKDSIISINGRAGTGKSSFLSFFYEYLREHKQKVVLWEIPYFKNDTPTWRQTIFFIIQLVKKDPSIILILDGTDALSSDTGAFQELIDAIKTGIFQHLCVSYGNDVGSLDTVRNLVESKNHLNLQFGGICVASKQLDDLLSAALPFFKVWHENELSSDSIKKFLLEKDGPRIINIDFQLLYMISQQSKSLGNTTPRYMYTFIKRYLDNKYKQNTIDSFLESVRGELSSQTGSLEPTFSDSEAFRYNTYAWNYALTTGIFDLLKEDMKQVNESNELNTYLEKNILLSSDVNTLLEDQMVEARKQARGSNNVLDHIISIINKREISDEAKSQLLYSACRLAYRADNSRELLKQIAMQTANSFKEQLKTADGETKRILQLQYRSASVILALCGDGVELANYNRLLLREKQASDDNLAFHLKYYFRGLFSFHEAITLDLDSVFDEMVMNTYYVLERHLSNKESDDLKPFTLHNLITFLHLCPLVATRPGLITGFPSVANAIICKFKSVILSRNLPGSVSCAEFANLLALIDSVIIAIDTNKGETHS